MVISDQVNANCTNKKTAISGGFFKEFGLGSFFARLPLLHRRRAGIAKVKMKVKAHERHGFTNFLG